jgi:hypothetical protein
LLRCGADLMTVRQVLEALRALREARLSESMQRLLLVLSELASPAGAQALFARARHVARDVDNGHTAEFGGGTQAVLSVLLDLIVAFIGADLSAGLVRQVWPDAAVPESASGASSAGRNL